MNITHNLVWKILFSSISTSSEDINTTKLLEHIAQAGFNTDFEFIENVSFSDDGIFKNDELFEFWFKLIPWENIELKRVI